MDDVYAAFMRSSDLSAWMQCLDRYKTNSELWLEPSADVAEDLTRGLCISIYVQWLSSLCGELLIEKRAGETFDRFSGAIRRLHGQAPSAATRYGLGLLSAWYGYRKAAQALLSESGAIGPEAALLIAPRDNAKMTAFLRRFVTDCGTTVFPPAFYFYCSALLDLGSIEEVRRLIADYGRDDSEAMIGDLMAKMFERSGRWREAYDIYRRPRRSPWPMHRYRAAICRIIAEGPKSSPGEQEAWGTDEAVRRALLGFETEIDQNELARCSAFVNACRWNTFDDWIVHFELGKLNFRRRRYCEADSHLKTAAARAPEPSRCAIARLRFANLTWLSGHSLPRDLPMEPEALECGSTAVEAAGDAEPAVGIRVWLASKTGEEDLLRPVFASSDLYNQGLAHEITGNIPAAIHCWRRCIQKQCHHRAFLRLIEMFCSCQFENTTDYLIDVIARESWDDFFVLWELGKFLLAIRLSFSESSDGFLRLNERLKNVALRIEELSQFEFQHLVRAYEFFSKTNRQDIAESLLSRASKLAESPEENLSLAIAWRRTAWFKPNEGDQQGLLCLLRAERESRDRLERLQIAREFCHYGRVQHGRHILEEEGIFGPARDMEPIEFVVALQCGPWLQPKEFEGLVGEAVAAWARDYRAGVNKRYAHRFLQRLLDTVSEVDESYARRLRQSMVPSTTEPVQGPTDQTGPAASDQEPCAWKTWHKAMSVAKETGDVDGEQKLLQQMLTWLEASTLDTKYALWAFVRKEMAEAVLQAATVTPQTEPEKIPISKSGKVVGDWRAQELSDLWREFIACTGAEDQALAQEKIRSFHAEEKRLLAVWEEARRKEAEKPRRRALCFAQSANLILSSLLAQEEQEEVWPVLERMRERIAADVRALTRRIATTVQRLQNQLQPADTQA